MSRYAPPPPPRDPRSGLVLIIAPLARQKLVEAILTDTVNRIVMAPPTGPRLKRADYLITWAALTGPFERIAMRMGALPVVAPEGLPWLSGKVNTDALAGVNITIAVKD